MCTTSASDTPKYRKGFRVREFSIRKLLSLFEDVGVDNFEWTIRIKKKDEEIDCDMKEFRVDPKEMLRHVTQSEAFDIEMNKQREIFLDGSNRVDSYPNQSLSGEEEVVIDDPLGEKHEEQKPDFGEVRFDPVDNSNKTLEETVDEFVENKAEEKEPLELETEGKIVEPTVPVVNELEEEPEKNDEESLEPPKDPLLTENIRFTKYAAKLFTLYLKFFKQKNPVRKTKEEKNELDVVRSYLLEKKYENVEMWLERFLPMGVSLNAALDDLENKDKGNKEKAQKFATKDLLKEVSTKKVEEAKPLPQAPELTYSTDNVDPDMEVTEI